MNCPGCGATIGRFRAAGEAGERVGGVTCVHDGMEYELQQVISQPAASAPKANKRRKSRRPSIIAQRRADAAARRATTSKGKQRKANRQRRIAEALAA
jgi:hypothetical protein